MKVFLDTIGCRLNQAEIETLARQFRSAGHEIVGAAEAADLAVVNTCAVTSRAASDSMSAIRRISRRGRSPIVATGCWASLEPTAASSLPRVVKVVPNVEKDRLVAVALGLPGFDFELEPVARQPLPGLRHRTRASIKVQDGCDNHCTFCITAVARGKSRSLGIAEVLADVRAAVEGGAKEVVLTGVHLGSWGREAGSHLRTLIRAVLDETSVDRVRLSSIEPWDLDEDFFSLWANPRLCRHLHLPLQSGSARTLRRMARKTTPASFRSLVASARRAIPDVAITTDLIAGFPGETDPEFAESVEFVGEMEFAGGHTFTYSPRPGTAATRLNGQLPPRVGRERNAIYRSLIDGQARSYRERFIGRTATVLWEATNEKAESGGWLEGLTDNFIRVSAWAAKPRWNRIDFVKLTGTSGDRLRGVIRKSG